jgi:HAD superfamily hydrolase (TIGR01509 family)
VGGGERGIVALEIRLDKRWARSVKCGARLSPARAKIAPVPSLLFDLDGTLVDSVYQHVIAWRDALEAVHIDLPVWKIHRRIGMSGGLFVNALTRELDGALAPDVIEALPGLHADAFTRRFDSVRPLPGAAELLASLTEDGVAWAIATSGAERSARLSIELLGLPEQTPLVTRDQVRHAKPDPDLFLAAADLLGADIADCVVVGDSVWDLLAAQRARALGVGLLSGGYGREELIYAGAYRVYEDPRDLLEHLYELGVRRGR